MLDQIAQVLYSLWLFDIAVFSNPWMYVPLGIPAMFYLCIFFLKWIIVTAPVWLPIAVTVKLCRRDNG